MEGSQEKRVNQGTVAVAALVLLFALQGQVAHAATISVNTTADELNSDGDCSLREAIEAGNANAAVDACPAGEAAPTTDVVGFGVTGTITLVSTLPSVSEALTIDGPGVSSLTISGEGTARVLDVGEHATLDLKDVTVANGSASQGGGIFNAANATLTVANSAISGNSAPNGGGGIFTSSNATLTVTNSAISGNDSDFGGGIRSTVGGTVTIANSTVSGNSSSGGGGGIVSDGTLTITRSTFSGNSAAGGFGGGIYSGSPITITNSTFFDNSAFFGGGALESAGTVTVTNSTFSGNSAGSPGAGGAIDNRGGPFTLRNTIVANSPSGGNCSGIVPIIDGGGNLQHPGTDCEASITSSDPLLDPDGLQDNGGPTETIIILAGSPAIDAAVTANCPATDQRGIARPQGAACDIGAVEVFPGYARPISASPLQVALVPAYLACSTPNRTHGPPLAHPSCAPPAKLSQYATVGSDSVGHVRMVVLVGVPSSPPDEADVRLTASITDVRATGDLSDYDGELLVAVGMRTIDKYNGPSLVEPATGADTALSWPVACTPTPATNIGATCTSSTTADALVPAMVNEGKRAIWTLKQVQVADGGEDGHAATTGDNTPFLKQGVFVP